MFIVNHHGPPLSLGLALVVLSVAFPGSGCRKSSLEPPAPDTPAKASAAPVPTAPPSTVSGAAKTRTVAAPSPSLVPQRPLASGQPRPAAFKRYDEPKEGLEFFARKRAPVGERAVPSERYRAARERITDMPVYSTRTGTLGAPGGRGRGQVGTTANGGPDIGTWSALGPGNIGGRTRAIVIHPTLQSTIYAAAVAGGVWKTLDAGVTWTPTDDAMANLSVGTLAMDPNDSNTLLAGTGEGYFNADSVRGAGIFKTTNAGGNWTQIDRPGTGINKTCEFHYVNKIVYSRQQANTAYAAIGYSGSCDGTNTGGVYRTIDGGTTWTRILTTTVTGGCLDLAVRADLANDTVFASCGTFAPAKIWRTASAFTATGNASWTDITTTVSPSLKAYMGRTSLAIAPSNQALIYAISADNYYDDFLGLWRSTDGGFTWSMQSSYLSPSPTNRLFTNLPYADGCFTTTGIYNQGWYDNVIAVDPSNENLVWVGGIDLFRSENGGSTFGLASAWYDRSYYNYAHADQHAIVFNASGSLYVGNDGGIYRSDIPNNGLAPEEDLCETSSISFIPLNNGYGVTQFYYGAVLPNDREYFGGTQDNGTVRGTDGSPNSWFDILGGDGGAVAVNPIDTQILYGEYTYGAIRKTTGQEWFSAVAGISDPGFEFIAPFVMDPTAAVDAAAANRLWTGGRYVWRTTNGAASWQRASSALASSTTALAVAPSNPNFALAGTRTGAIHRTTAALSAGSATVWPSKSPRAGYVSSVTFDPWNANVAYATYSTFGGTHVWKSGDAGATWSALDGTGTTIPDLPVHSIVVDPTNSSRLYLGTDLGVFVSTDGGLNWLAENTGFGHVVTEHLVLNGANLYAFTHGRGVWRVPLTTAAQTALVEVVSPSSVAAESTTPHQVQVRLRTSDHAPLGSPATVDYSTSDLIARAGSDYTATSGTLTFPMGSTDEAFLPIDIGIVDDTVCEPVETLTLHLSNPVGAILARRVHTVKISDNDGASPPEMSINDITVTEGNSGTTNATFTVKLSCPAKTGGASVQYQTADGTGVAGADYIAVGVPTPLTASLPAGSTTKAIAIPVVGNTLAQISRDFVVNLSGPTNATLDDGQGRATIVDNDFSGTIQLSAATYSVAEKAGNAMITLKRTGGVASGVTVQVQAQAGTATGGGVDFSTPVSPVSFAAGATTASFMVPITNDSIDEPAETILLRIFSPTGLGAALGAQQTAILTINDDDVPGLVRFGLATYAVAEGGGIDLKVTRSGGAAGSINVGYTVTGTATGGGTDYTLTPASLTFAAGETMKTIHVDAVADGAPEGNETVVVTLNPPGGGATLGAPSSTVLTITDLEPTFAFTASQVTVAETATAIMATVRRTGPLTAPATVSFTTNSGTATGGTGPGDDFTPTSGVLTFLANIPTRTITVPLRPDSDFEAAEAFSISLSAPSIGTLPVPGSSITVNIPNNDVGGTFYFGAPTYTVLESKPSVLLTVKRTGGLANADVTYTTANGTATSGSDFTGTGSGLLHFAAGKTSATITIPILQDTDGEGSETFSVTLSSPTAGGSLGAPATTTVTIQDEDRLVSFGVATYAVKEPLTGTVNLLIPVKRTGPAGAFNVTYSVGGTATGPDFTLSPASPLVFQATDTVKNLTLTVNADVLFEGNETVALTLTGPTNSTGLGAVPATTVNITDQQPVISFGAAAYKVTEPAGATPAQAVVTVKRVGNLQNGSDVTYTINDGTAIANSDYSAAATPTSPLHFSSGQSLLQLKIPILPDTEDEPAETLTVTLSSPNAAHLGSLVSTTVTINDNDTAGKIQIVPAPYAVLEDVGSAVIKLTRTLGAAGSASVVCRTANGTATAGSDYTATTQTVTFGPGQTSATCTIPIIDDGTAGEGAETVLVSIDTPSFGVTIGTPSSTVLYIVDND